MQITPEQLLSLITRENITFLLACIGSLGTFIAGLKAFFHGRKKISVEIIDYTKVDKVVQFFFYLQNHSSNSLCISSVYLKTPERSIRCELLEKRIRKTADLLYRTPLFPLNLAPHVGAAYFLEFLNCPDIALEPGKKVSLEFHTNRGLIKKSLSLPEKSHYLHIG